MATNPQIKTAVLKKLKVTPQRLSQLAKARKSAVPMTTEQAIYTIAHDKGIDISKHLSGEDLLTTRQLLRDLANLNENTVTVSPNNRPTTKNTKPRRVTVSVKADRLQLPGMTGARVDEAKNMAERVYPRLYFFENSLRDMIERVLRASHGDDWWKTPQIPKKVFDAAFSHKTSEARDPWHGKRGAREIDYTHLSHLWDIIKHNWGDFKPFFPNQAWIEDLVTNDMNVSRRVIAHMNPLNDDDVKNIEAAFRKWAKQRKAIEDKLP